MTDLILSVINKLNIKAKKLFLISAFILPTIPLFSSVIILLTSLTYNLGRFKNYFKNKWNYPFLIITFFLLNSFFWNFISNSYNSLDGWSPFLSFLGLANWIPFFFIFWSIDDFLQNSIDRKRLILFTIAGTIPIAISGLFQIWFEWSGPFRLFNGLIIWYQNDMQGLSGPFSNANYASLWLAIIFQFCICDLINLKRKNNIKRITIFSISVLILSALLLTKSRSGILSIIYSTPLLLTSNFIFALLILSIPIIFLILLLIIKFFPLRLINFLEITLPQSLFEKFDLSNLLNSESFPRVYIWDKTLELISNNPINGYGGGALPFLLKSNENDLWFGHAHNLPLDIAVSYGLPSAIIISFTVYLILYLSCFKIYRIHPKYKNDEIIYDKGWFSGSIVFVCSHLVDVQYFDYRISILGWILLCGLKNIINNKSSAKNE